MRFPLTVLAASMLLASLVSAAAQNLAGQYRVEGTNPNGTRYSGIAEIIATSATTCRINWITGGTTSSGICMHDADNFAAGYAIGEIVGLVIYEIQSDGALEGTWTVADQEGTGEETLTPVR